MPTVLETARREIDEAIGVLEPQVRGLSDLANAGLSSAAATVVQQSTERRTRRRALCSDVAKAIDVLLADGYPDLPDVELPDDILREIKQQLADMTAAVAEFTGQQPATSLQINLGQPTDRS